MGMDYDHGVTGCTACYDQETGGHHDGGTWTEKRCTGFRRCAHTPPAGCLRAAEFHRERLEAAALKRIKAMDDAQLEAFVAQG